MTICPHCRERYMEGYRDGFEGRRRERLDALDEPTGHGLPIEVAAKESGISRRSLYYWMKTGRLPFAVVKGHRRVFLADILAAPVYQRDKPSTSEAA